MLKHNIKKIIKKIAKYAKQEADKIETNKNLKKTEEMLYDIVDYRLQSDLESIVNDWYSFKRKYLYENDSFQIHYFELFVIRVDLLINIVKNIKASSLEKYEFLTWYLENLKNFFLEEDNYIKYIYSMFFMKNFLQAMQMGYNYDEIQQANIADLTFFDLKRYGIGKVNHPLKQEYLKMNKYLKSLHEKEIEQLMDQNQFLTAFGIDKTYLNDIKSKAEQERKDKEKKEPISKEVNRKKEKKENKGEKIVEINKKTTLENQQKRKNYEKLLSYINPYTLESTEIIEGQEYKVVVELLNQFFSPSKVNEIKRAIIRNNQTLRENKKWEVVQLLLNEEQICIYKSLYVYFQTKENANYEKIIGGYLNQIDELIDEYLNEKEELLIPDYKEQIDLIFNELDIYISYIPNMSDYSNCKL